MEESFQRFEEVLPFLSNKQVEWEVGSTWGGGTLEGREELINISAESYFL